MWSMTFVDRGPRERQTERYHSMDTELFAPFSVLFCWLCRWFAGQLRFRMIGEALFTTVRWSGSSLAFKIDG